MSEVSDLDIMKIESKQMVGKFLVVRLNIEDFDVYLDNRIVFGGNDEDVAEYINENQ